MGILQICLKNDNTCNIMRRFISYITLLFVSVQSCLAFDTYSDAEYEVNTCINYYLAKPTDDKILEETTKQIEEIDNRIKVTLAKENNSWPKPYEIKSEDDYSSFSTLKKVTSLMLLFFQSLTFNGSSIKFNLEKLNQVNSLLDNRLKITKLNLKKDNLEFIEVTFAKAKWCYIQNLSKDKSYTFKIQGSSGHFEGGVFPNSLRLVGSNIGYPGYSKPISIKIVSESNYHYY